jgi:hypothetical protein
MVDEKNDPQTAIRSGRVPIVASDPVTYTVTAVLMIRMAVDPRGQDTATVVIAVGTGTTNL